MKGDYDDAVSNAVGSNIFDICVALGLPLLATLYTGADIALKSGKAAPPCRAQESFLLVQPF